MKNKEIENAVEAQVIEETPVEKKTRTVIRFRNPFVKEQVEVEASDEANAKKKPRHEKKGKKKISGKFIAGLAIGAAIGASSGLFKRNGEEKDAVAVDCYDDEEAFLDAYEAEEMSKESGEVTEE